MSRWCTEETVYEVEDKGSDADEIAEDFFKEYEEPGSTGGWKPTADRLMQKTRYARQSAIDPEPNLTSEKGS